MKYVWIALAIIAIIIILFWIYCLLRRRWAIKKVCRRSDAQKCEDLNTALEPFGFQYDMQKDMFCSNMHSWQRKMGYGRFYDENAPVFNMDIDSEPFYFLYDGFYWLIEVWKGQYGMSTGGEVGIYKTTAQPGRNPRDLFYESVPDSERLPMSIVLRKNNRILFERSEYHWWLTGFKLGEFSYRHELCMTVKLTFPNLEMRNAFCEALRENGYSEQEIGIDRLTVCFCFCRPKTNQPKRCRLMAWWIRHCNKRNCRRYFRCTKVFRRTIDRVDYIGFCFPGLYKILIRIGKTRSMTKGYKKITKRGYR